MLVTYFLKHACQLIKQAKKQVPGKFVRVVEILNDAIMKKEVSEKCVTIVEIKIEIDKKLDAYEKQLRSKYIELMN